MAKMRTKSACSSMISGWVPRCGYGPPHPDHPALHLLHFRCPSMDEGPSILQIWSTGEGSGCVWQVWRFVSAPHKPGGSSDEAMISRTIVLVPQMSSERGQSSTTSMEFVNTDHLSSLMPPGCSC
ncbi:hypothetical protein ZWY2020_052633 [Hordeum vulgare]|nr:hypothetical protein ZWY2020_052633 [Hordeum vulgare]